MSLWRSIFEPKKPDLTLADVSELVGRSGYPMFVFQEAVYQVKPGGAYEQVLGLSMEMLEEPTIFCVMDKEQKKIASNELGPVLFLSAQICSLFAEKAGGVPRVLSEALHLAREARRNDASAIVVPNAATTAEVLKPPPDVKLVVR